MFGIFSAFSCGAFKTNYQSDAILRDCLYHSYGSNISYLQKIGGYLQSYNPHLHTSFNHLHTCCCHLQSSNGYLYAVGGHLQSAKGYLQTVKGHCNTVDCHLRMLTCHLRMSEGCCSGEDIYLQACTRVCSESPDMYFSS